MESTFRLNAEITVKVSSVQNTVLVNTARGVYFGEGEDKRTFESLALSKSEARAIASSIMACAASI